MLHSKLSPVHYGRRWASSVVPNDRRRGSVLSNDRHWALVGPMIGGGVQLWSMVDIRLLLLCLMVGGGIQLWP